MAHYIDRLIQGESLDFDDILIDDPDVGEEVVRHLESYLELSSESVDQPLGTLGDYTLRRQIGRGGMGVVYEAWQNSVDRQVALKVLPAGIAADTKSVTRFIREAKTAAQLKHPNVVAVHAMGVDENTPYYAMEYVEGETLAQILTRIRDAEPDEETPFGKKDDARCFLNIAEAFADVADGLQHAHSRGVVHRDIKPSNLILDGEGKLRILDFGLARLEGQESLTLSGDLMGTILYMSPEQAMAKRVPLDHRTDIYSLGATMYEALTGQPPFKGKDQHDTLSQIIVRDPRPPRPLNPAIPADLETIILKCLRKDPKDRYGTAEALAQDLRRLVRGAPIEARPESPWAGLARRSRRHLRSVAVGIALLTLTFSAGWLWYTGGVADQERRDLEYREGVRDAVIMLTSGQFSAQPESDSMTSDWVRLPRSVNVLPLLGEAGTRSIRDAAAELRRLTKLLPRRRDAHYHLARAYQLLGDVEAAARETRRTLEIDRDFVPARALERALTGAGVDLKSQREVTARPGWQTAWLEAYRARQRKDWIRAARAYTHLLEAGKEVEPYIGMLIEAYLGRGVARLERQDFWRAQEDFAVVRAQLPECLEAALLLGRSHLGTRTEGGRRRAEQLFEELYSAPGFRSQEETAIRVALVYTSLWDFETALRWADRLEPSASRDRLKSHLLRKLGRWGDSARAAKEAIEADPDSLEAHFLLAESLLNQLYGGGDAGPEAAFVLAEASLRAVELDPKSRQAHFLIRAAWDVLKKRQATSVSRSEHMIDLQTRLTSSALAAGIVLSGVAVAYGQEVFDDFLDGNVFDGSPVSWGPECWWSNGIYDATSGDLSVGSNVIAPPALPVEDAFFEDSVSVRTQVRIRSGATAVITAFASSGCGRAYNAMIRTEANLREFYIERFDGSMLPVTTLNTAPLPSDFVPEEDHLLQLDVRGESIEMRVWKPGEPMPQDPTLSAIDHTYRSGTVGLDVLLGDYAPPQRDLVVFRYFQASPEMIVDGMQVEDTPRFLRGDCNADGTVNISDATCVLNWLFVGGDEPGCVAATNTNGDEATNIADATYLLNHLFSGGPAPIAPFPDCGPGTLPADEELGCANPPACQ